LFQHGSSAFNVGAHDLQGLFAAALYSNAERVLREYKFLVVFENSNCNQYVSEKLWRALSIGVIPVYFGAPDVGNDLDNMRSDSESESNWCSSFLPTSNSAILATKFSSPKVS
jgi:hypothetical protein